MFMEGASKLGGAGVMNFGHAYAKSSSKADSPPRSIFCILSPCLGSSSAAQRSVLRAQSKPSSTDSEKLNGCSVLRESRHRHMSQCNEPWSLLCDDGMPSCKTIYWFRAAHWVVW